MIPSRIATSEAFILGSAMAAMAIFKVTMVIFLSLPPNRPRALAAVKLVFCTLSDQFRFEFSQGGKDTKYKAAIGRCCVDLSPCIGKHLKTDIALVQFINCVNQMFQITPQAAQFPNNRCIAWLQRL